MKIFVAGGSGVLGRAALPALIAAGHEVRATARGEQKAAIVRALGAEPVEVDLFDENAVRRAIAGSSAVLRLTTKFGAMAKLRDPRTWRETILLRTAGARILVDAAIAEGIPNYVHESVTFVYRDGGEAWIDEQSPTDDAGIELLRATLEGEREAQRFTETGGRGVVLRFGGFYGAEAPSTLEAIQMATRLPVQIGAGANYFSSIYTLDAGRAVAESLNVPPGIYNVVDDDPVRFAGYQMSLVETIGARKPVRLPGFLGKWIFGDVWKFLARSQRVSNAKLKAASNWRPAVGSVREGWPRVAAELAGAHPKSMAQAGDEERPRKTA